MPKNHQIKVNLSKSQIEKVRYDAEKNGYVTLSAYLRDIALKNNYLELRIAENNMLIKRLLREMPWKEKKIT